MPTSSGEKRCKFLTFLILNITNIFYKSSYAQLLAASTISKLITRNPNGLSLEQRLDIRNYILNYLASNAKLAPFVLQALVTLFARITKLGWFESTKEDEFVFREIIPHITPFVQVKTNFFVCRVNRFCHLFTIPGKRRILQYRCAANIKSCS